MFASSGRLPYLYSYEGAKKYHDNIKPLRNGARMGRKPLGGRRDTHMYIQENAEGNMECVCYETAVVTFKQDGGVLVIPGKWPSSFTCAFIEGILPDTSVNRVRGTLVLHINRGADKYPLKEGMSVELVRVPVTPNHPGKWEVRNAEGVRVWSPNRAKANSVRAKYKEMLGYHKGIVSLLAQEREKNNEDNPFEAAKVLVLPKAMLADTLGTMTRTEHRYNMGQRTEVEHAYIDLKLYTDVRSKPTWGGYNHYEVGSSEYDTCKMQTQKRRADWYGIRDKVLALMCNDQPEETKHANFLKAALGLMCAASGVRSFSIGASEMDRPVEMSYSAAVEAVTKFITLAHAEEIMELKQLPVGRVPTTNYAEMLFDNFRSEGEKA
jgi:hypothetical protein